MKDKFINTRRLGHNNEYELFITIDGVVLNQNSPIVINSYLDPKDLNLKIIYSKKPESKITMVSGDNNLVWKQPEAIYCGTATKNEKD